jgi:hypothetical protein
MTQMTTIWKKRGIIFGSWGVLIALFSGSGAFGLRFIELFPVLIAIPLGILTFLITKDPNIEKDEETQRLLEVIDEYETMTVEHLKVIKEYEEIFDTQLVELPCICGGNTFKGLFTPNTENDVQCEKCKNNYRVTINYDTVLIAEPMDQRGVDKTLNDI